MSTSKIDGAVLLKELTAPFISNRAKFPATHQIVDGLSPWSLGVAEEVQDTVVALTWSVVSYDRSWLVAHSEWPAWTTSTFGCPKVCGRCTRR
jgi:hypothetical protein